jgi:hypothetical protein
MGMVPHTPTCTVISHAHQSPTDTPHLTPTMHTHTAITISYADRSNLATSILQMAEDLHWCVPFPFPFDIAGGRIVTVPGPTERNPPSDSSIRPPIHTPLHHIPPPPPQVPPRARNRPLEFLCWVRCDGRGGRIPVGPFWGQPHLAGQRARKGKREMERASRWMCARVYLSV